MNSDAIKNDYFYDNQVLEENESGVRTFSFVGKDNVVQVKINAQDKVTSKDIE